MLRKTPEKQAEKHLVLHPVFPLCFLCLLYVCSVLCFVYPVSVSRLYVLCSSQANKLSTYRRADRNRINETKHRKYIEMEGKNTEKKQAVKHAVSQPVFPRVFLGI